MNKEKLLSIINKYVGYAEQKIYDAVAEYEEEKINFAKKHCKAALKEASEKAEILLWQNNDDIDIVANRVTYIIEELKIDEVIKNSYLLNNIK
jgi:hypothetical protein